MGDREHRGECLGDRGRDAEELETVEGRGRGKNEEENGEENEE